MEILVKVRDDLMVLKNRTKINIGKLALNETNDDQESMDCLIEVYEELNWLVDRINKKLNKNNLEIKEKT